MGTNKKYWKGLDELNQTPDFVASTKNEFAQELSVDQFLAEDKLSESSTGRRDFLKFLGFSVAAATLAACESPVVKAVPYAVKPEDVTPGVANWYASSYYDGETYASVLVKTREGRPIHIKGNKNNGFTKGGSNARIIGSVLSLYDGERLQNPQFKLADTDWATADADIIKQLKATVAAGKKVALLSNTVISPSTLEIIAEFGRAIGGDVPAAAPAAAPVEGVVEDMQPVTANDSKVQHIQYDAISYNGIRQANLESFGKAVIPDYDFSKAKTIVSVGADFMNSWVLPTQFLGDYVKMRNPEADEMSRHFQFESNMSITGSNADYRSPIKPSEQGKVLGLLFKEIGGTGLSIDSSSLGEEVVANVKMAAQHLKASKGKSIVVAGSNRKSIQVIVNAINSALNNYDGTINLNNPILLHQSEDAKMAELVKDMQAGKIGALISWDTNPVYTYGDAEGFKAGLAKVGLSVSMSRYADESASLFTYICPDSHALESWNDFNPKASHYSLAQPTIRPLHNTRPAAESLMIWAGMATHVGKDSKNYHDYIQSIWEKWAYGGNPLGHLTFHSYWSEAVHNSCMNDDQVTAPSSVAFAGDLAAAAKAENEIKAGGLEISFYQKAGIGSGIHSNNPWLQELPDPISKVTWDNYVTMSPEDMKDKYHTGLGQVEEQNVVSVKVGERSIDLPVYPQPGQAAGTIGIAFGYGRGEGGEAIGKSAYQQTGIYGEASKTMIGANAFKLAKDGVAEVFDASISDTGNKYILACTQTHATVMARNSIMKETTFEIYKAEEAAAYNHRHTLHTGWNHDEKLTEEFDLWNEHPVEVVGHRWAMSIDLNLCVGCGACVVACGSENNVPVVGRDEVRRGREMQWLRIDRYYASEIEPTVGTRNPEKFKEEGFDGLQEPAANPKVAFMPMLCQHCNHAPCETVCPVAATTHSNEGLNQMTYNRCIGTRYCANNCPYKVRRFNWFNYPSYRKFTEVNPAQDDLGRMVLNPDVVVRTRGVMEKCSFCIQKIQTGKLVAKKAERPVMDGDVTTACADACPSDAIAFGDWNDTESGIRKSSEEKRAYQALEEIGIKPNIWYKVKVRNEENAELKGIQTAHGSHGGEHETGEHGLDTGHDTDEPAAHNEH